MSDLGQDLMNVPFDKLVGGVLAAVVKGHQELQVNYVKAVAEFAANVLPKAKSDAEKALLLAMAMENLHSYVVSDAEVELRLAISTQREQTVAANGQVSAGVGLFAAAVDARYSNSYNYKAEGASTFKFRLQPVSPSPEVMAGIRALLNSKDNPDTQ